VADVIRTEDERIAALWQQFMSLQRQLYTALKKQNVDFQVDIKVRAKEKKRRGK
jgi:hypothetical protein